MIFRIRHFTGSGFLPPSFIYINIIPGPDNTWAVRKDEVIREHISEATNTYVDTTPHNTLYEKGDFNTISSRYLELVDELRLDSNLIECDDDHDFITINTSSRIGIGTVTPSTFLDVSVVTQPACKL